MTDYTNDIKRYLSGEMNSAERHALEKKALSDPFLADALEGAQQLSAKAFEEDVQALEHTIDEQLRNYKTKKKSRWPWTLRIAAAISLAIISSFFLWQLNKTEKEQLVLQEKQGPTETVEVAPTDSVMPATEHLALAEDLTKRKERNKDVKVSRQDEPISAASPNEGAVAEVATREEGIEEGAKGKVATAEAKPTEDLAGKVSVPSAVVLPEEKAKESTLTKLDAAIDDEMKKMTSRSALVSEQISGRIQGRVTSAEDGSALPGVNVVIKGTTQGTITDVQGNFELESAPNSTLVLSFIGLQSQEVKVGERQEVDVAMNLDVTQLSEVVVTGYGTATRDESVPTLNLAHPEIGNRAFRDYLEKNIRYPLEALDKKVEGRVTAEFFVEMNGSLTNFSIIRGIGAGCDEELIRLIREGPAWVPTKRNELPVRDKVRVRLKFELPK